MQLFEYAAYYLAEQLANILTRPAVGPSHKNGRQQHNVGKQAVPEIRSRCKTFNPKQELSPYVELSKPALQKLTSQTWASAAKI